MNHTVQTSVAQDRINRFLNAELLSELDEEYRAANQAFRKWVTASIGSPGAKAHPLAFLINPKTGKGWRSSKSGKTYDAGHTVPVQTLSNNNWKRERLVVEDRNLNRSTQVKRINRADIIDVDGIPVDRASLVKWAATNPALSKYLVANQNSGGWDTTSRKVVKEFEFVWTYRGPFVRSTSDAARQHPRS